jgi:mono/diheme cytochrome c family protein
MFRRNLIYLLPVLAVFTILQFNSCTHQPDDVPNPDPDPQNCDTSNVTYNGIVYPILQDNCISCHSGAAPQGGLDFTDYSQVAFVAENGALLGAIRHQTGYTPMPQNGNKLDDCKIRQIEIWVRDTTFTEPPVGDPCDPDTVYFSNDVLPILLSSCAKSGCHDATAQEGVRLDSYAATMASGVVVPFDLEESEMWEKMNESDPEDIMPPPPDQPLDADRKEIIRKWIAQGALNLYCDESCDTFNVTFGSTIWPNIIQKHCLGCHSGGNASGGISLDSYDKVKAQAQIPAGQPGSLLGAVTHAAGNSPMPQNQPMISDCKIAQLQKWINEGMPNN